MYIHDDSIVFSNGEYSKSRNHFSGAIKANTKIAIIIAITAHGFIAGMEDLRLRKKYIIPAAIITNVAGMI